MSADERNKIDVLIEKFDRHAKQTAEDLETVKRGIYGDKANKVMGLLDRQDLDEKRIGKLEENQKKAVWWGSGLFVGLQRIWYVIVKWFNG